MKIYTIKYGTILTFALALCFTSLSSTLIAQDRLRVREYTNPDEIVTFDRFTSYVDAIEIISQFVQEFEKKFIVDRSNYTGQIGVSLPPMHWKDALRYILEVQNLQLNEQLDYYEIVRPVITPTQAGQRGAQPTAQAGVLATDDMASLNSREIRINATFFEGNRRALQEVGIDWSTLTTNAPANVNDFTSGGEALPSTAFSNQFVSVNSVNASQVSQNVFNALVNFGEVAGGVRVQALFSAFESNNLGNVLATPSIKVIEGKEGRIQVGQDFSIKQRDFAGNVTDQFFNTGTILTVTPTVITNSDTSFIYLEVAVEQSSAQPDAVSTIISKRVATTDILLINGEATAIAGLYRTEETSVRRGVPILKDLPPWFFGLRYLFGYNSDDYLENELVILIQAELERPLRERIANKLNSKNEVLTRERDRMRADMDLVLPQDLREIPKPKTVVPSVVEEKVDTVALEVKVIEQEIVLEDEVIEEQLKEAEELSFPISNPELMVVVPKAFSLEEYLKMRENGEYVDDKSDNNLKYFVIGGAFLVPNNALNFQKTLESKSYNTRLLHNTETKFNYVAYYSFNNIEEAISTTRLMQRQVNPDIWMFTFKPESTEMRNGGKY